MVLLPWGERHCRGRPSNPTRILACSYDLRTITRLSLLYSISPRCDITMRARRTCIIRISISVLNSEEVQLNRYCPGLMEKVELSTWNVWVEKLTEWQPPESLQWIVKVTALTLVYQVCTSFSDLQLSQRGREKRLTVDSLRPVRMSSSIKWRSERKLPIPIRRLTCNSTCCWQPEIPSCVSTQCKGSYHSSN